MDSKSELLGALRQTLRGVESGSEPKRRSNNLETTLEAALEAVRDDDVRGGRQAVAAQRARLEQARSDLETQSQSVPPGGNAEAIVDRIRSLYAQNAAALDALDTAVAALDEAAVEQCSTHLRDLTAEMFDCHDDWQAEMRALEQHEGGSVLVPEAYGKLYDACEAIARGQIIPAEWKRVLDAVESEVTRVRAQVDTGLETLNTPLEGDTFARAVANEVQRGLSESLQGLHRMRDFARTSSVADLNEGWTRLVAGNVRVQKAMRSLTAGQGRSTDVVILEDE
ncbi:MAG: hypothetical protein EB084_08490 [Proteobacteria bacterium]|nr:hypothetical protein [Pseudomonadota bacterium]